MNENTGGSLMKTIMRAASCGNRTSKTHICRQLLSLIMVLALAAGMLVGLPARAFAEPVEIDESTRDGSIVDGGSAIETELGNSGIPVLATQAAEGEIEQLAEPERIFKMAITTPAAGTTFMIPVASMLDFGVESKTYNWNINWGDGTTQTASGTSSESGGIPHVYTAAGNYVISITPNGSTEAWLAAFGFCGSGDPNRSANKSLVTGIPSPLRPEMTRTHAQISATTGLPSFEWADTFHGLSNLTQAPTFEGWENVSAVGDSFANLMFYWCESLTTLPAGFTLPQGITKVGNNFACGMFAVCERLTTLPAGFNLPRGITSAGNCFADSMFLFCFKLTSLPTGFNLPQGITTAGYFFASSMFFSCYKLTSLPAGFNLPQGITTVKNDFADSMFSNCSSLTSLPAGFNLPQGIASVGSNFSASMFSNCSSLTSLPTGFNLPQGITTVGSNFADSMFFGAGSATFQINNEFRFPAGIPANAENAFRRAMQLSAAAPVQNRTAASIIGNCPTPNSERNTFNAKFVGLAHIHVNWGGSVITKPPIGAPGSGDIDGDGIVTMAEAMTAARVAIGAASLSPEETAAIDMDGDGAITMTDALRVMRKAIGL